MGRHVFARLLSHRTSDENAELEVYIPRDGVAVLTMRFTGQRGRVRSETVQLDREQREKLADLLRRWHAQGAMDATPAEPFDGRPCACGHALVWHVYEYPVCGQPRCGCQCFTAPAETTEGGDRG